MFKAFKQALILAGKINLQIQLNNAQATAGYAPPRRQAKANVAYEYCQGYGKQQQQYKINKKMYIYAKNRENKNMQNTQ